MRKEHESYGMISISRFSGGKGQFFGSDIAHNGGISIKISKADVDRKYNSEWYHSFNDIIEIEMSHNQYVDAITSGMNTSGVPCTLKRINGKSIPQIDHIENKKEQFSNDMKSTHDEYAKRIDSILEMLDGNVGKKKANEIKHQLDILKTHMSSNTNFVMTCFNENMEKTVVEAKRSISNYIDQKVHSIGIEGLREQLQISIESDKAKEINNNEN